MGEIGLALALALSMDATGLQSDTRTEQIGPWLASVHRDDFENRMVCDLQHGTIESGQYMIVSEGRVRAGRFRFPNDVMARGSDGRVSPTGTAVAGRNWWPSIAANASRGEATFNDSYFTNRSTLSLRDREGEPVRTFDLSRYAEAEAFLHAAGCPNTSP